MLYGGSLLWHTGRFGIRSAFALRIISGTVILNFGVAERLRVFRYSFFHRWGHYSATSCGSAALRAFPAITSQNKKAIAFAFLHQRWLRIGAADEARTRYLHLGKVALYQMSYGRISVHLSLHPPERFLRISGSLRKLAKQDFVGKRRKSGIHHRSLACKTSR